MVIFQWCLRLLETQAAYHSLILYAHSFPTLGPDTATCRKCSQYPALISGVLSPNDEQKQRGSSFSYLSQTLSPDVRSLQVGVTGGVPIIFLFSFLRTFDLNVRLARALVSDLLWFSSGFLLFPLLHVIIVFPNRLFISRAGFSSCGNDRFCRDTTQPPGWKDDPCYPGEQKVQVSPDPGLSGNPKQRLAERPKKEAPFAGPITRS